MDLLDFSECKLYFEEALPAEAERLIALAASEYGEAGAELALLRAHLLAPDNLTVLVGLYRYYFYQHRLEDALQVAERAMQISGRHLGLPADWSLLDESGLGVCGHRLLRAVAFLPAGTQGREHRPAPARPHSRLARAPDQAGGTRFR